MSLLENTMCISSFVKGTLFKLLYSVESKFKTESMVRDFTSLITSLYMSINVTLYLSSLKYPRMFSFNLPICIPFLQASSQFPWYPYNRTISFITFSTSVFTLRTFRNFINWYVARSWSAFDSSLSVSSFKRFSLANLSSSSFLFTCSSFVYFS